MKAWLEFLFGSANGDGSNNVRTVWKNCLETV